jgi:hypothetical protein
MSDESTGSNQTTTTTQPESLSAWSFMPKMKSIIEITANLRIYQTCPMPNRWVRFWQRVLLGWKWREYEG